jgi:Zn-finger nucleic acid-binding protein
MAPVGNRNHLHCSHCDGYHFPQETGDGVCPLGDPSGVSCLVCRDQPLQMALIDGDEVCYCDRCRGFLTTMPAFSIIVTKRRARHTTHEQLPGPFDPEELKRHLKCPKCKKRMSAHPYFGGGNAVVDTCDRCGLIWLDAGELAVIERYIPHVHQIEKSLRLADGPAPSQLAAYEGYTFFSGPSAAFTLEDLL